MVAVMIGIDPHKASHTAVAIDPAEVPLGQLRVRACAAQVERLVASRRGNRRHGHAIHMAAVTQIRNPGSEGRAYFEKKLAEGKTRKEALRALKRQVSDAIFACLQAGARRADTQVKGPGGQPGNHSAAWAAGSHPEHQRFGQATPGPGPHPTTPAGSPGRAGHSSIAAPPPPAKQQVQVERPQRSEDERPGGAARRQPYSATRNARTTSHR